jgi:RimJ/RimL family protein N-acetyltransferase
MDNFSETILRTQRLRLRFLTPDDAPALFPIYADPQAMRYWSSPPWREPAQAEAHVRDSLAGYASGAMLSLGVTLAGDGAQPDALPGTLIGVCRLYAFNRQNERCELGYMLSRAHWGHGYMQEALAAVISHGMQELGLRRIEADVDPRNTSSARLLERLHFRHEGHMRERWIVNGEICDTDFYGLLRSDWEAAR